MASILPAMQSAAIRLFGRRPTTFFGGQGKFELELTDLVNEVAKDVQKYQDWQALIRIAQVAGDGTTKDYPLPDDYDRMLTLSDVQDATSWAWGYFAFQNINDFLFEEARGFTPWPGGWIIYNDRLRFSPAPLVAATAQYPYITNLTIRDASTGEMKADFTADTDEWLLPERLLTLGLVWRWRENKGLATNDQDAFIKALDEYADKDRGSVPIRVNSRFNSLNTRIAYPWTLGGV